MHRESPTPRLKSVASTLRALSAIAMIVASPFATAMMTIDVLPETGEISECGPDSGMEAPAHCCDMKRDPFGA